MKVDLRVEKVAAEESLDVEKARVQCGERELATKVDKRQLLLAKRRETNQTESHPLVEGEDFLCNLSLKVVARTVEKKALSNLATKATEKLNAV